MDNGKQPPKEQTGLLTRFIRRAEKAVKRPTIQDLDGFKRPDGMDFKTYRQLRFLKNLDYKRRRRGRLLWVSSLSHDDHAKALLPENSALRLKIQGTYCRAKHGQLPNQNV